MVDVSTIVATVSPGVVVALASSAIIIMAPTARIVIFLIIVVSPTTIVVVVAVPTATMIVVVVVAVPAISTTIIRWIIVPGPVVTVPAIVVSLPLPRRAIGSAVVVAAVATMAFAGVREVSPLLLCPLLPLLLADAAFDLCHLAAGDVGIVAPFKKGF